MNVEPAHAIDPEHFRRVMGRFATGVTVVTAIVDGQTRGMTANAFMSGSLHPPLCIVSIAKRAHMHDHLVRATCFSVSILAAGQEAVATHFAGRPVPGFELAFADIAGTPALPDACAVVTAVKAATYECGDHTIFIGHIKTMQADGRPPLLFHAARFAALVPLAEATPGLPEFW